MPLKPVQKKQYLLTIFFNCYLTVYAIQVDLTMYATQRLLARKLRVAPVVLHRLYGGRFVRRQHTLRRDSLTFQSPKKVAYGSERLGNIEGMLFH